jgi:hypothetical protein
MNLPYPTFAKHTADLSANNQMRLSDRRRKEIRER